MTNESRKGTLPYLAFMCTVITSVINDFVSAPTDQLQFSKAATTTPFGL